MSEQYLVDTTGKTIGIVIDPDTYRELVQAREELHRLLQARDGDASVESHRGAHSIHDLRGLGKEIWTGLDVQSYLKQERDSWDG